ncbi:hypothetical protein [Halobacteriovorax sp.]|uniref:hypothetical protein n=1 Tax=Halobacteriovorax sp. TaxID=2020862 RepID=UPI003565FF99
MKFLNDYKHIFIWIPFTVFLVVLSSYLLSNFYGPYHQFWQGQAATDSANSTNATSIGNLEYEAYKDYFYNNSFNKFLNYKISADIWTNQSDSGKEKMIGEALQLSIAKTLERNKDLKSHLIQLLHNNLMTTFIENFISTLRENSIENGKFQVDINFTPQFVQNLTYEREQSAEKLVNLNQFTLKDELEKKSSSLTQLVIKTPMPSTHKEYQYGGGVISILIDLQKMKSDNKLVQVKFRRYFRANKLTRPDIEIGSKELKLKMFQLLPTEVSYHNFITIDLYKSLSLDGLGSVKDKAVFHFGKVVPSTMIDGQKIKTKTSSPKDNSVITGDFYLHGKYTTLNNRFKAKLKLDKLVYSFQERKFTTDTELSIKLYNRTPASIDKDRERININNLFINESAEQLVKALELEKFIYDSNDRKEDIL